MSRSDMGQPAHSAQGIALPEFDGDDPELARAITEIIAANLTTAIFAMPAKADETLKLRTVQHTVWVQTQQVGDLSNHVVGAVRQTGIVLNDPVVQTMKRCGIPITRENYITHLYWKAELRAMTTSLLRELGLIFPCPRFRCAIDPIVVEAQA